MLVSVWKESWSEDDSSLLGAWAGAGDHDEVTLDETVGWPAAEWVDALVGGIELSLAAVLLLSRADESDELVDVDTVEVAHLTSTTAGVLDVSWVPGADTSDLSVTTSGLAWKSGDVPAVDNTLETTATGDGDGIDLLANLEDIGDLDLLFEEVEGKVDLGSDVTAVDLELDDLSLLGLKRGKLWLGVGDQSDDLAVLLESLDGLLESLWLLGSDGLVLGESGVLLWLSLVEPALDGFSDVRSPDGVSLAEALWSLDVAGDTAADHGWGIEDGDLLDNLLHDSLVGGVIFDESEDVGATSLVGDETSKVWSLLLVINWEGLDVWAAEGASGLWKEAKVAFSAFGVVSVCHAKSKEVVWVFW